MGVAKKTQGHHGRGFCSSSLFKHIYPWRAVDVGTGPAGSPSLNHGFVGTEHVLLGLLALEDGVVPNVLNKMGVDREAVRWQIENWVGTFPSSKTPGPVPYTPRVKKSLCFAAREAKVSQNAPVGAEHILLGLVLEGDGVAGRVLRDFGLSPETTREEIMREVGRNRSIEE